MPAICCGFPPMMFGSKAIKLVQGKTSQITNVCKNQRRKGSKQDNSCPLACNFMLMMELRKKIITFRDIIDLPPCNTTLSTDQMIIRTMQDLHKYYPESIPRYRRKKFKRLPLDKILIYFYKALQDLADISSFSNEGVDKSKFDTDENEDCKNVENLVEVVVGTLNGLIKMAREKSDMVNEDEENEGLGPKATPYSEKSYGYPSPISVLPEYMDGSLKSSYASPLVLALDVQAVRNLSPADLKQLKLHMIPNIEHQVPSFLKQNKVIIEEHDEEENVVDETRESNNQNETSEDPVSISDNESGERTTDGSNVAPTTPLEVKHPELPGDIEVAEDKSATPPTPAEVVEVVEDVSTPQPPPATPAEVVEVVEDVSTPQPPATQADVLTPIPPPPPLPPTPPLLQPNVESRKPPTPPPQPNAGGAKPTLVAKETEFPSPGSALTKTAATGVPSPPPPPPPPAPSKPNFVSTPPPPPPAPPVMAKGEPALPPPPAPPVMAKEAPDLPLPSAPPVMAKGAPALPPPPTPPVMDKGAPALPPPAPPVMDKGAPALPPPPPPTSAYGITPPPAPSVMDKGAPDLPPPPPPTSASGTTPPPPPPVMAKGAPALPPPPPTSASGTTPPPAPPVMAKGAPALPPPPPPTSASGTAPPLPPPMMPSKGTGPAGPPPPAANGAAPPPPAPGALRMKKAASKLKRSSHMGNLYRKLKGKVEGVPVRGASSSNGKKSGGGNNGGGKQQGMADALLEMTKRSKHFIQIEEDAQTYEKSIKELRTSISTFKTKDMPELLKFHKYVESILENLADETQVLARFEGFPDKKLEALRIASALYSKLESILNELQNWKIEPPLAQLLDKVERYFDKIKIELDALERNKDAESKKLKGHNIDFDFQILVRIKEALVDVSSNCMELALKERKETKLTENEVSKTKGDAQKKAGSKLLWRAFQFAFRVYTFAGGHDDRAEKLTRELAQEIETDHEDQQ